MVPRVPQCVTLECGDPSPLYIAAEPLLRFIQKPLRGDRKRRTIAALQMMTDDLTVHVELQERSYDILITTERLSSAGQTASAWFAQRFPKHSGIRSALVVTDRNVTTHAQTVSASLQALGWNVRMAELPPGERTKSLETLSGLYDAMVAMKADRHTAVIAVGGGVIGDAAGFLAATYARGVPFIQVPTTLLADVDSSVGGKVGINHPAAKNMIGAFYQPLGVFIDTGVLSTLPDREYRAGLAEVVKYGVILDALFFEYLESHINALNQRDSDVLRHVISRSCRLKADVVELDEYERTGLRAVLNYGHTFGHAFEALCGYGELLHGEAVSIGMLYASRLAERLGRIDATITARQQNLLLALGLPIDVPGSKRLLPEDVVEKMRLDKKTVGGELRFVLPTRLGHVETVTGIAETDVRSVLERAE